VKPLENGYLKNKEEVQRVTLTWMDHRKMEGGWNWLKLCPIVAFGMSDVEPSDSATQRAHV
jgi:hypothetical protein